MVDRNSRRSDLFTLYLFFCLFISGLWKELARTGPPGYVLLALVLFIVNSPAVANQLPTDPPFQWKLPPLPRSAVRSLLIGLVIWAPSLSYFILTWSQEFPFKGDHGPILLFALEALDYWRSHLPQALLLWAGILFLFRKAPTRYWSLVVMAALLVWSRGESPSQFTARYPGAFYFLALPFNWICQAVSPENLLNANRLVNVLSIPAWLFILRPALLKRWPDAAILPIALFLFYQKDIAYYFASNYLEPWTVILVLLTVESMIVTPSVPPWLPCLLCGMAAMVKEQAILLLPMVWFSVHRGKLGKENRSLSLLVGIVSGLPFVLYSLYRRDMVVWRKVELASWADITSLERLATFGSRLKTQFGMPGLAVLACILAALVVASVARPALRRIFACSLLAALVQVLFFYCDAVSLYWTGYPRFHFLALPFLGIVLLAAGHSLQAKGKKRLLLGLAFSIGAAHLPPLAGAFRLTLLPDPARNFTEHYDAPVYFPIRALLRQAEKQLALSGVHEVLLNDPMGSDFVDTANIAYPDLRARYGLRVIEGNKQGLVCRCRSRDQAVLLPVVFLDAGLRASKKPPVGARKRIDACVDELKATCQSTFVETMGDSQLTGALGVGIP